MMKLYVLGNIFLLIFRFIHTQETLSIKTLDPNEERNEEILTPGQDSNSHQEYHNGVKFIFIYHKQFDIDFIL